MTLTDTLYANTASVGVLHPACGLSLAHSVERLGRPDFYTTFYSHLLSESEQARSEVANMLRVDPEAICLTSSTSHGIALFLNGLALKPEDIIAVGHGRFVSVEAALSRMQLRLGITQLSVGDPATGRVTVSDLDALPRNTKALVIDWVNYWSGYRNDIAAISQWSRLNGIPLLVDGVQGVGACPFDFDIDHVSALASGCHKWLRGPEGTGFLYVAPWMLERLTPIFAGYRSLADPKQLEIEASQLSLSTDARQFEVGTISHVNFAALAASLKLINSHGYRELVDEIRSTASEIFACLSKFSGVQFAVAADRTWGIVSFKHDKLSTETLLNSLREHGVIAGVRHGFIRLSCSTDCNADALCGRLDKVFASLR